MGIEILSLRERGISRGEGKRGEFPDLLTGFCWWMAEEAEEMEYCMRAEEEGEGGAWRNGGDGVP